MISARCRIASGITNSSWSTDAADRTVPEIEPAGAGARDHVLRNSWLPIISMLGLQVGSLMGGAVITDVIFAWVGWPRSPLPAATSCWCRPSCYSARSCSSLSTLPRT